MNFLQKISKFQINQVYKTEIWLRDIKPTYAPKPTNKAELKIVLEAIWNDLPEEFIKKAVLAFRKRLQACIRADDGHFEHLLS